MNEALEKALDDVIAARQAFRASRDDYNAKVLALFNLAAQQQASAAAGQEPASKKKK